MVGLLVVAIGVQLVSGGRDIRVGLMYSGEQSSVWPSERTRHVAQLALSHASRSAALPPDTTITLVPLSTDCDAGHAIRLGLPFIRRANPLHLVIGPSCSTEGSALISFLAHPFFRNDSRMQIPFLLPESSYTESITELETTLHRRLVASELFKQPNQKMAVNHFGWHRIGIIYDEHHINQLKDIKDNFGSELVSLVFLGADYTHVEIKRALQSFIDSDVKIIRFTTYGGVEKVICAAEEVGMLEPDYVWWAGAWLWPGFQSNFPLFCTPEQMERLRETDGPLDISANPMNFVLDGNIRTDVGRTTDQFYAELQEYYRSINYTHDLTIYDPYVYDSVWAVAKNAEVFVSESENRLERIFESFEKNEFYGVSGKVGFRNGEPKYPTYHMKRLRGWDWTAEPEEVLMVGEFGVQVMNEIDWVLGKTPLDYTPRVTVNHKEQLLRIDNTLVICIDGAAALMIVMLLTLLSISLRLRDGGSTVMNSVIVLGAVILMLAVIAHSAEAFVRDVSEATWVCRARVVLVLLGFNLAFGALLAKAWRAYRSLTGGGKVTIPDASLLVQVLVFIAIDIAIFAAWQVSWPIKAVSLNSTVEETEVGEFEVDVIQWKTTQCDSESPHFAYALLAEKALLLLFGGFIAFETRNVEGEGLEGSKAVGVAIYNVGFCCALAYVSSVIVSAADPTVAFVMYSGIQILCTVFIAAVVFGPAIGGLVSGK